MTWTEAFDLNYEEKTTFWSDFSIADHFGLSAIKDTYKRASEEWHTNYIYMTELVMVLNCKCWYYNERDDAKMRLYSDLYYEALDYCYEHFTDEEKRYLFEMTD